MTKAKLTLKTFHVCGRITFHSPFSTAWRCLYPEEITAQEYGIMTEGQYTRVRAHFEQHAGRLHPTHPNHHLSKNDVEFGTFRSPPARTWDAEVRHRHALEHAQNAA